MTRRSDCRSLGDLDIAGVAGVYAAQRRLALEVGRPVCGEFSGFAGRRGTVLCRLAPRHAGPHDQRSDA